MLLPDNRLSSRPWSRLREQVLEKGGYKCSKCHGRRRLEVHHIIPRHIEPDKKYDIMNLTILCNFCHKKLHYKPLPKDALEWQTFMKETEK